MRATHIVRRRRRLRCEECGKAFVACWALTCSEACSARRCWRLNPRYRAKRARIMRRYRDRHPEQTRRQKWAWRIVRAEGAAPPPDVLATRWSAHQEKPRVRAALAMQAAKRKARAA